MLGSMIPIVKSPKEGARIPMFAQRGVMKRTFAGMGTVAGGAGPAFFLLTESRHRWMCCIFGFGAEGICILPLWMRGTLSCAEVHADRRELLGLTWEKFV